MAGKLDPSRFPDLGEVLTLTERGIPAAYGVPGTPECQIRIFPNEQELEILVRGGEPVGDLQGLRNLGAVKHELDGVDWHGVRFQWTHSALEPFLFACGVADRVQVLHESLPTAVDVMLVGMRDLLRRRTVLSREKEVGLLGELLVLRQLIGQLGCEPALAAWLGAVGEEHDFSLPEVDLEVKTTTSESRCHWITTLTQLVPKPGRSLRLVSIQVTASNADTASTLGDVASDVLANSPGHTARVHERFQSVGYRHEDHDLYPRHWELRTAILEFLVDDDFPRITSSQLSAAGVSLTEIPEVSYRVNLEGREPVSDPILLAASPGTLR
jgi:hypothetical protein